MLGKNFSAQADKVKLNCFTAASGSGPQPRPAAGEGKGLSPVQGTSRRHPFSPLFTPGAPLLPHSWPPFITDSISLWHILGSRMLRSQGEALYQCSRDTRQDPWAWTSKMQTLALDFGLQARPGLWLAGGLPPPSCSQRQLASPLASLLAQPAALVGFPRLYRSDSGCQAPESPSGADSIPQPREGANPGEPASRGDGHFTWVSAFAPARASSVAGARAPLLRLIPPKLISSTC